MGNVSNVCFQLLGKERKEREERKEEKEGREGRREEGRLGLLRRFQEIIWYDLLYIIKWYISHSSYRNIEYIKHESDCIRISKQCLFMM